MRGDLSGTDPDNLVDVKQAARLLNISKRAIIKKINNGVLPATRLGSKWILNKQTVLFHRLQRQYASNKPQSEEAREAARSERITKELDREAAKVARAAGAAGNAPKNKNPYY